MTIPDAVLIQFDLLKMSKILLETCRYRAVFLNRRAAARHWALASIIPGHERFSWKLSF
jgi:hypothetical protein